MITRFLCLTVVAALIAGCAQSELASAADDGAVHYVAPNGDDGDPGTREAPWRTPEHAGEVAAAGDTVIFLPGEYSGRLVPENSGTADAPIVFRADQRRTARLVGHSPGELAVGPSGMQSRGGGARIEIEDRSHIEVRGFAVHDTARSGGEGGWARIVGSSNITFADCSFSGGYVFRSFWVESSQQIAIVNNNMSRDTIGSDLWGIVSSPEY